MTDPLANPDKVVQALVPAVTTLLAAMTVAETLREKVDAIKQRHLDAEVYPHQDTGERITEPKRDWLIADEDWKLYHAKVDADVRAAGFDVPEGYCPALMAEHAQSNAQRALIEASEPFFGVTTEMLLGQPHGLEKHREFIDLLIKLVVNHPRHAPSQDAIMAEVSVPGQAA